MGVVHLAPITDPTVQPIDDLIGEVAGLIGRDSDPNVRARALRALDRAADRLNMAGVYLYRQKDQEYPDANLGGAFTDAQATLTLPTDWGWAENPARVYDDQGTLVGAPEWVAWDVYQRHAVASTTNAKGVPELLSILSELDESVSLYPSIDTSAVTTITLSYYARLLRPSDATGDSNLYATQETFEALQSGGEAFIMRFRYKDDPRKWKPFMDDFRDTLRGAKAAAARREEAFYGFARPAPGEFESSDSIAPNSTRTAFIRLN
jgi:hypothetical protein